MKDELLHTPDGVRDIYNGEMRQKLLVENKLHSVLLKYGYHDIQTPTFEFFNIFSREIGTTPSKDLYKFFDKEGNTLVLRPDFTPSIARSAAKYYVDEDMPIRLCYMGNTFTNHTDYKGRLKEITQCGAELMGELSASSDAEILAMVVESLKSTGLKEFKISVGHAQIFSGLVEAAGLSEDDESALRELISNKNFFGVEEFVDTLDINDTLKELFAILGSYNTELNDLVKAKEMAKDYPVIAEAIASLEDLVDYLKVYEIDKYISIEPGIIGSHEYYTGIIFAGYTFGTGEPIVRGGRYDKLLSYFGKNAPAIGFAIAVDMLLMALSRQKIEVDAPVNNAVLVFDEKYSKEAIKKAMVLRRSGVNVETVLFDKTKSKDDYFAYASKNNIMRVEFIDGDK